MNPNPNACPSCGRFYDSCICHVGSEDYYKPMNIEPGNIYHDERGVVSHSNPSTYIILSGERVRDGNTEWEWKAACFYDVGREFWMGAPVVILWDQDIARLRYVGKLQSAYRIPSPEPVVNDSPKDSVIQNES